MNTIYLMTSPSFKGDVSFEFNDADLLISYDLKNAELTEQQQVFILQNLPRELKDLQELISKSKTASIKKYEVTFEDFWNKYDDKENSGKKRTMVRWNNMRPSERMKAFLHIPKYFASLPPGTRKKFAETYLNHELWNN